MSNIGLETFVVMIVTVVTWLIYKMCFRMKLTYVYLRKDFYESRKR